MNAHELIDTVASKHRGVTKAEVERIIVDIFSIIKTSVQKGNDVKLVGFGTFLKAKRKARVGRNPQTGVAMQLPATNFPKFRPGTEFKNSVK